MKSIDSSPVSSRPSQRHNNVVRSTVIMLLGLAGLLWWNNTNPNNIDFNDAIPVLNGFGWHQVFIRPLCDQQTDSQG